MLMILQHPTLAGDGAKKLKGIVVGSPGLPDFSWCRIPKPEKNVSNEYKMY
jgi:hypothetical protein